MARYLPLIANLAGALTLVVVGNVLACLAFSVDARLGWALICVAAVYPGWRLATYGDHEVTG